MASLLSFADSIIPNPCKFPRRYPSHSKRPMAGSISLLQPRVLLASCPSLKALLATHGYVPRARIIESKQTFIESSGKMRRVDIDKTVVLVLK